jgi:anaerobic selenocysteine-containing dehydrogenase
MKIVGALKSLDLLVAIEPHMTVTAALADYILPPVMMYEHADMPLSIAGMAFWPVAWSQYTAPLVEPPEDADVVEDWYVFWALAKRLGRTIRFDGAVDLDMEHAPTTEQLIAIRARHSLVPLDEIKAHPGGKVFDLGDIRVLPGRPGAEAKFDVMPDDVAAELAEAARAGAPHGFTHLIASRRMRDLFNSNGYYLRPTRQRNPLNPAGINPADMASLDLAEGDEIEIVSENGRIRAVAKADATLRPGVITISHGWGGLPGDAGDPRRIGSCVNPLISDSRDVEAVNAMPRMSAVPVNIRRIAAG